MERSDFLKEAFRFGILARSAQRQILSDLPCLYTYVYIHYPGSVSNGSRTVN
nr:MAG TPA_asm: hypothetical protein [Microviridae sp.]